MANTRSKTGFITGLALDKDWMNNSLLLPLSPDRGDLRISDKTYAWMYYSTADTKFTNTTLGGNFSINNPPQFTTFADPPTGLFADTRNQEMIEAGMDRGMGQYYSESIDDHAHLVTLRFGVPEYKGLFTFFTGFYNIKMATLANQGRTSTSLFYLAANVVGSVLAAPINLVLFLNKGWNFMMGRPSTRYYWLKVAMPMYWNRVNLISNHLAAVLGIVPEGDIKDANGNTPFIDIGAAEGPALTENESKYTSYAFDIVKDQMPELFTPSGGIDIYRVAHKANRMAAAAKEALLAAGTTAAGPEEFAKAVQAHISNFPSLAKEVEKSTLSLRDYQLLYHESILGATTMEVDGEQVDVTRRDAITDYANERVQESIDRGDRFGNQGGAAPVDPNATPAVDAEGNPVVNSAPVSAPISEGATNMAGTKTNETIKNYANQDSYILPVLSYNEETAELEIKGGAQDSDKKLIGFMESAYTQGAEYISFKVDHVETMDESWSNNAGEAEITSTINGMSETVRAAKFSFSNFNTGFAVVDAPIKMITDTITGFMDSFHISGLAALAGTGLVDIPQVYKDSSTSFPSANYNMELRTPYGDPLSIYLNLYIPLISLMAGALPISHGNQSYGAPMLCQLFDPGRNNIKLGMIDSLSVTRGTGDVGWNPEGLPLGLDVSFSVMDLSSIMHMPIDTGLSGILPFSGIFGGENAYSDYIATIGNLNIDDQVNPSRKIAINMAIKKINRGQFFNKARASNALLSGNITRMFGRTFAPAPPIATR